MFSGYPRTLKKKIRDMINNFIYLLIFFVIEKKKLFYPIFIFIVHRYQVLYFYN